MSYKYSEDINSFFSVLNKSYYKFLPLQDFSGNELCYIPSLYNIEPGLKKLYTATANPANIEDEIIATSAIENIDTKKESVRKILNGSIPDSADEKRIYGLKLGLDFINNPENKINEDNFYKLYKIAIGDYLDCESMLPEGYIYRNDKVFIVGNKIEHTGLSCLKIPEYMDMLFVFIADTDDIPTLIKAAIIHFYIAYIHPYFDGNGRMARLVHLWFLIQNGFTTALFSPFSTKISKTKNEYYKAFSITEENIKICGRLDLTPFIKYFFDNVYSA